MSIRTHKAFRAALATMTVDVQAALVKQGCSPDLSATERTTVEAATAYGVGPYDTAAQIMADRTHPED